MLEIFRGSLGVTVEESHCGMAQAGSNVCIQFTGRKAINSSAELINMTIASSSLESNPCRAAGIMCHIRDGEIRLGCGNEAGGESTMRSSRPPCFRLTPTFQCEINGRYQSVCGITWEAAE